VVLVRRRWFALYDSHHAILDSERLLDRRDRDRAVGARLINPTTACNVPLSNYRKMIGAYTRYN